MDRHPTLSWEAPVLPAIETDPRPRAQARTSGPAVRSRPRVMFFSGDVTLAHVGRMITLARALPEANFDVALACGPTYRRFVEAEGLSSVEAHGMSSELFAELLAHWRPLFDDRRLAEYVRDDLRILS